MSKQEGKKQWRVREATRSVAQISDTCNSSENHIRLGSINKFNRYCEYVFREFIKVFLATYKLFLTGNLKTVEVAY